MKNIYIVVEGGVVKYVSADHETPLLKVHLVDLDDLNDAEGEDKAEMQALLDEASPLTRIW